MMARKKEELVIHEEENEGQESPSVPPKVKTYFLVNPLIKGDGETFININGDTFKLQMENSVIQTTSNEAVSILTKDGWIVQ